MAPGQQPSPLSPHLTKHLKKHSHELQSMGMADFRFPWYVVVDIYIYDYYLRIAHTLSRACKHLSFKLNEAYLSMPTADDLLYHLNLSPIPRAFPQFPLLPAELRYQIWALSLPGPRVIEIRNHTGGFAALNKTKRPYLVNSICRVPALLHICHESREEALKHYDLAFGMGRLPPKISVDFSKDITYFGPKSDFYLAQGQKIPSRLGEGIKPVRIWRKLDVWR
jgi:hypothetical protein